MKRTNLIPYLYTHTVKTHCFTAVMRYGLQSDQTDWKISMFQ